MFWKVLLVLAVIYSSYATANETSLTLPLVHLKVSREEALKYYQQNQHHLRHFTAEDGTETYPLHSLKNLFTLTLIVNGFTYNLSVDTGSSDLFIKGEDMQGQPQRKFSCKQCVANNQYVHIGYLDGRLDTYIHNSTVKLGEHEFSQNILVAYSTNNIQNFMQIGGIVGLSFQQKSKNPNPNFINTLINQKIISRYRFGLKLNFNDPETSFITFGGMDHKHVDPSWEITYYDIIGQTLSYRVQVQKLHFGDKEFQLNVALIDSGNTCLSIDSKYTEEMLEALHTEGNQCQFVVEQGNKLFKNLVCTVKDFDALPVITLVMPDGKNYSFEKQYYLSDCYLISKEDDSPLYKCNTYIESTDSKKTKLYLGAAWMLKYYVVFDLDKREIGMAKNNDNPGLDKIIAKARISGEILRDEKRDSVSTDQPSDQSII